MVTRDDLDQRRALLDTPDLAMLLARLREKAAALLDRRIIVPDFKAQLSVRGGRCPHCGGPLVFDPWNRDQHQCADCGQVATGDLHRTHWARPQHLWVAERAAHLATVGVLAEDERCAAKAKELLVAYETIYPSLPNRDNVLGPSRLFFSTYLESIWILNYLAAAMILRERGWLSDPEVEIVNGIADETAAIIGEFNEGMSNRQTWNSAALTAIGAWFGDEELIQSSVEARTGLVGHLTDGFGSDGMWFEGENYHLFALRGLLTGIGWARSAGADLLADAELRRQLGTALLAPAWSALPDFTFPARKDSRYGVSLAHPAYLECWEAGLAGLGDDAPNEIANWLDALYQLPTRPALTYDAYLHDAGLPEREVTGRADLSWWMLLTMRPTLDPSGKPWAPGSALLGTQGLAVLRRHDRYASLECGEAVGGHGHPDRLQLTVHSGGIHWLPDPGTGSYVTPDLHWYRSTLAHNAPMQDGQPQQPSAARCSAFDEKGDWSWAQGEWEGIRRSIIAGPEWLLDLIEQEADEPHRLELPWHLHGEITVESAGTWVPDRLDSEFVTDVERFVPAASGPIMIQARNPAGRVVRGFAAADTLLRARGPGLPGQSAKATFLVARAEGARVWLGLILDLTGSVSAVELEPGRAAVTTGGAMVQVGIGKEGATITGPDGAVTLGGLRPRVTASKSLLRSQPIRTEGQALRIDPPPALDGTIDGFDLEAPLEMADEMHYERSEEPYPGPEEFSATAYVNWDEHALYVAVVVAKPEVIVPAPDQDPLELDNEPDDIHADGVQVYVAFPGEAERGYLIRPAEDGSIVARPIPGTPEEPIALEGGSAPTEAGYCLTFALPATELAHQVRGAQIEFDLVVNEMRSDRVRRAGQLVWAGGGGWVYLRGDRHERSRWGVLDLVS